jgi:hypothetical protein
VAPSCTTDLGFFFGSRASVREKKIFVTHLSARACVPLLKAHIPKRRHAKDGSQQRVSVADILSLDIILFHISCLAQGFSLLMLHQNTSVVCVYVCVGT